MRKIIVLVMSVVIICGMSCFKLFADEKMITYAAEGGNIYLDATTGVITDADISIISANIPSKIKGVSVTKIGSYAFYRCENLKSVIIPDGVTSIENDAFGYCSSLNSITLSDSIKSIEKNAFYSCTGLINLKIPKNVTSIGIGVFSNCSSLTEIVVSDNNRSYLSENGVLFNKNKTEILCYPAGKTGIQYTIPDSIIAVGEYAFCGSDKLTSIVIPDSVTSIGTGAFSNCSKLVSVIIPDGVINLGNQAFYECSDLKSVSLPKGITDIGYQTFHGCISLGSVAIPDNITKIENTAFQFCSGLTCITIPESVISIGNHAFYGCSSLEDIIIPKSVTNIGADIFYDCNNLSVVYCYKDTVADNINLYPQKVKIEYIDNSALFGINIDGVALIYNVNNQETAVKAVENTINIINNNANISIEDVKYELANFIDEAIGLSVTADIPKDGVITKGYVEGLENRVQITKYAMDKLLSDKNVSLSRDLLTSVTIKGVNQIQISSDLDTMTIDNLHIDMGNYGGRITIGKNFIEDNVSNEPLVLSFVLDGDTEVTKDLVGEEVATAYINSGKFFTNYKLNTPVILSLPLLANTDITYQAVKGPDGFAVSMPNAITGKVQFRATQSGTYTVTNVDKLNFTDVNSLSKVQQDTLRRLYAHGLIEGKSATSFAPNTTLTRAEFTTLLLKTIGQYDPTYKGVSGFVDVSNQWHAPIVAKAKNLGIIAGYDSDDTFRPDNKINNEQLYHILGITYSSVNPRAKASDSIINSMVTKFNDGTSIAQWARENVAVAVNANIYTESQSGNFNSKNEVTRLNSAIAIGKLFEISPFEGDWK